tara:strand:+ start:31 stop:582 length:552 start_codon:yes stop_codon:yes gene_type:complete
MHIKASLLLTILAIIGHIVSVRAQSAPTINSTASAQLIEAITLSETTSLNFGTTVLKSTAGGTVVLSSNSNTRNYTGGLAGGGPENQNATNATFEVSGSSLATYAVTLPAAITLTHTSTETGINTMEITAMKARFNDAASDSVTSTISSEGTDSFSLGATLTVQENQILGQYSGQYEVSVDYN